MAEYRQRGGFGERHGERWGRRRSQGERARGGAYGSEAGYGEYRSQRAYGGQPYQGGYSGPIWQSERERRASIGRRFRDQGYGQSPTQPTRRQWRGPKGYTRSDERIKEDLSEHLLHRTHLDASEVSIDVKDGKVTLHGTVPQRRMKHEIEDIADACPGVIDIENQLRVSQAGTETTESRSARGTTGSDINPSKK